MGAVVAGVLALGAAIVGGIMAQDSANDAIRQQKRNADEQKKAAAEKVRLENIADMYRLNDDPAARVMLRNRGLEMGTGQLDSATAGNIDQIERQKALAWLPVAAAAGNVVGAVGNQVSTAKPAAGTTASTTKTFNPTGAYSSVSQPSISVVAQPLTQQAAPVQTDPSAMIPVEGTSRLGQYGYGDPYDTDPYRAQRWRFAV